MIVITSYILLITHFAVGQYFWYNHQSSMLKNRSNSYRRLI